MKVDNCLLRRPITGRRGTVEASEMGLELVDVEDRAEGGSPRGNYSSEKSVGPSRLRLGKSTDAVVFPRTVK